MMYYPGYELALHALCLMPDRLRAVVSARAGITDREIEILTKAGVVGVRFTRPTGAVIDDRLVRRTHEFGWGMHYLLHDEEQMWAWRNQILSSPGKFLIEHLGNPPVELGVDSARSNSCSNASILAVAGSSFRRVLLSRRRFRSLTCCRWSSS